MTSINAKKTKQVNNKQTIDTGDTFKNTEMTGKCSRTTIPIGKSATHTEVFPNY